MSLLDKYLAGWSFRTNTPSFEVGEEIDAYLTGQRNGTAVARIGDTVLHVDGVSGSTVDDRVRVRIDAFDTSDHTGEATVIETADGE